jgi:hypothetical protein
MKYYDESQTSELRTLFEKEVFGWSRVTSRLMFGCPTYLVEGKLFSFLVTNGIVITQIRLKDREAISEVFETEPFKVGEREITRWLKITLDKPTKIKRVIPLVRKSYHIAMGEEEA